MHWPRGASRHRRRARPADLDRHFWSDFYAGSAQFRKFLGKDYADIRLILVELGLAKGQ